MRSPKLTNFLVVATTSDNRVQVVYEGPPEQGRDVENIDRAVMSQWRDLAEEFPYPEFDVITARADSVVSIRRSFPELHGWDQAEMHSIEGP